MGKHLRPKKSISRTRKHQKYSDDIMAIYDRTCHLCGGVGADTIDHIVPVAWGGSDHPANLRPAHRSCNSSKGSKRPSRHMWTKPKLWEPGHGANIDTGERIKVPHWNYAGPPIFFITILLGGITWWISQQFTLPFLAYIGLCIFFFPILYNLALFLIWLQYTKKITTYVQETNPDIPVPEEWIRLQYERKQNTPPLS